MLFFPVNVTYDCFVVDPEIQGIFFSFRRTLWMSVCMLHSYLKFI